MANQIKIWHNPNCSKSKEAYAILQKRSLSMSSFDYLNDPLSKDDIIDIMKKLNISDIRDMLRVKEDKYSQFDITNTNKTEDEIIEIVLEHRILIERPIIIREDKAVIARPIENLINLIN